MIVIVVVVVLVFVVVVVVVVVVVRSCDGQGCIIPGSASGKHYTGPVLRLTS